MVKKTVLFASGLLFASALLFISSDAWAQAPATLDKATVSAEVAKRTLVKAQISADGGPPTGRRVPRLRAESAGRSGHVRDLRACAERRHRRCPRDGWRAPDWCRDRAAQGQDGALRADAVERRRTALQYRGRSLDSPGPRKSRRPGLLLRGRWAADRRPGPTDWRHRRWRGKHGRAVRLPGADEGARAATAAAAGAARRAERARAAAGGVDSSRQQGRWGG